MITKELLLTAAANFEKRAKNLKNFDEKKIERKSIKYTFRQIKEGIEDIEQLEFYKDNHVIYVLRTAEDKSKEIYAAYHDRADKSIYPNKNGKYNNISYSHNNYDHYTTSRTVLYVGKANNDIKTRLLPHLTRKTERTFSLHLPYWNLETLLDDLLIIDINIIHFDKDEQKLLNIEDTIYDMKNALWNDLKPMFGRQGKNPAENKAINSLPSE